MVERSVGWWWFRPFGTERNVQRGAYLGVRVRGRVDAICNANALSRRACLRRGISKKLSSEKVQDLGTSQHNFACSFRDTPGCQVGNMAAPASKRRKTEHVSSDEEADDASFASFSDSADANEKAEDLQSQESDDERAIDGELSDDGSEIEKNGQLQSSEDEIDESANTNHPPTTQRSRQRPQKDIPRSAGAYTTVTSRSNIFNIQVDDLLSRIRPKHGQKEIAAEEALHKLRSVIQSIPPRQALPIEEAERGLLSNKVAVPFPTPRPPKDAKYKLEYARPTNINVVGSYGLKSASRARKTVEIDMTVTMPSSLFQEKDYLDYRYFYKRAYYLACIAAGIQDSQGGVSHLRFWNFRDDRLKPILVVSPTLGNSAASQQGDAPKWQINIIPCIGADVFSLEKISPIRTSVRSSKGSETNGNGKNDKPAATPFYNSSIRSDMLMASYLKTLDSASKRCTEFRDACLLGSTWLRQRGLSSSIHNGGFGNFELNILMALLLEDGAAGRRPILSERYSSYQLFKATLQYLTMKNASREALSFGSEYDNVKPAGDGAPVLWDGTRGHNLLYKMTSWSYNLLRHEARTTLNMLSDQQFDGFEAAFVLRTDSFLYRYDYILQLSASLIDSGNSGHTQGALEEYQRLHDVLKRGLSDRVNLLFITPQWTESWELGFIGPGPNLEKTLLVGFAVNPDTVHRTVDHGPSAENKSDAASFREFWGEKAELRRFKDGSIQESLVWAGNEGGQSVIEQIVRYLVSRHVGEQAEQHMRFVGDECRKMLPQGSRVEAFQSLADAYKQLESDIRGLENLPLSIRQMMPCDSKLRYASINPPGASPQRTLADVSIQFEGSARWPDDLVAIQRTKIAFLLKIADQLQESVETLTARIGLEHEEHDILNQAFLDVIYDSGAAFRVRVHHEREEALLARKLMDKSLDPRSKEVAALGLANYKRDYIKGPAFTQAIARLCSRYPALSGTIRLTKKWFASHLLSNNIANEVIEMLVAQTFLQPWPWQAPSSVQTGFLRILLWISRWDWRAVPLIVDLGGSSDLKQADIQAINANFEAWRKLDPGLNRVVLFCGTNVDPDGIAWTDGRTPKVVAGRMTALARAACAEVEDQLDLKPSFLFSSPLSDFDFVIHLNPDFVKTSRRRHSTTNGATFKNLELNAVSDVSRVGYLPVREYLKDLEKLYGSSILFFHGGDERPLIAALWNPQTATRVWKLNIAYPTVPKIRSGEDEGIDAEIDKVGIIAEIARIGGDIIRKIEVHRN